MRIQLVSQTSRVLRQAAEPVSLRQIRSPAFRERITRMISILRAAPGVGLAGPQVGWGVQVFLIEDLQKYFEHLSLERLALIGRRAFPLQVFYNPVLEITDPTPLAYFESCLSYPDTLGAVIRVRGIRIKFLDAFGNEQVMHATDWLARAVQHEFEHLKGKSFVSNFLPGSRMSLNQYLSRWKTASSDEIFRHFGNNSFKPLAA